MKLLAFFVLKPEINPVGVLENIWVGLLDWGLGALKPSQTKKTQIILKSKLYTVHESFPPQPLHEAIVRGHRMVFSAFFVTVLKEVQKRVNKQIMTHSLSLGNET